MATIAMSGNDTIIVQNRILNDLAVDNCVELTFDDDIASLQTGKTGNTIYGLNESGRQATAVIRVIRGSGDDRFLNNLLLQQQNNFAGFVLLFGTFVKKMGDGAGTITNDTYQLGGGVFQKQVAAKTNVTGEADQSVSEYNLRFANAPRAIG